MEWKGPDKIDKSSPSGRLDLARNTLLSRTGMQSTPVQQNINDSQQLTFTKRTKSRVTQIVYKHTSVPHQNAQIPHS